MAEFRGPQFHIVFVAFASLGLLPGIGADGQCRAGDARCAGTWQRPEPGVEVMSPRSEDEHQWATDASNPANTNDLYKFEKGEQVKMYYAELNMARWTVFNDKRPFNLYHSGLAFEGVTSGLKVLADFGPRRADSVAAVVFPSASPAYNFPWLGPFSEVVGFGMSLFTGDVNVTYENWAMTSIHHGWPERFTNFTGLGHATSSQVLNYFDWVRSGWAARYKTFDTVEVYSTKKRKRMINSVFCHDFVTKSLAHLQTLGVVIKPEKKYLFRDHIILFAEKSRVVPEPMSSVDKRAYLRYLRFAKLYVSRIKKEFGYVRDWLQAMKAAGVTPFLHTVGKYYKLQFADTIANYCHMQRMIPPNDVNYYETDLMICALPQELDENRVQLTLWERLLGWEAWADEHQAIAAIGVLLILVLVGAAISALKRFCACVFSRNREKTTKSLSKAPQAEGKKVKTR